MYCDDDASSGSLWQLVVIAISLFVALIIIIKILGKFKRGFSRVKSTAEILLLSLLVGDIFTDMVSAMNTSPGPCV